MTRAQQLQTSIAQNKAYRENYLRAGKNPAKYDAKIAAEAAELAGITISPPSGDAAANAENLGGKTPQQYFDAVRSSASAGASIPELQAAEVKAKAAYDKAAASNPLSGSTAQVQANMEAKNALEAAQQSLKQAQQNQQWAKSGAAVGSTEGATLTQDGSPDANQVANPKDALLP
jgi:hypothetical protein